MHDTLELHVLGHEISLSLSMIHVDIMFDPGFVLLVRAVTFRSQNGLAGVDLLGPEGNQGARPKSTGRPDGLELFHNTSTFPTYSTANDANSHLHNLVKPPRAVDRMLYSLL